TDFALHQRCEPARLLLRRGYLMQQIDVALVRGLDVESERSQRRPAGGFEHDRHAAMIQSHAAEFLRRVRRQQSGLARQRDQFAAQRLRRAMRGLPPIVLVGNDRLGDETLDALTQLQEIVRKLEVYHVILRVIFSRRRSATRCRAQTTWKWPAPSTPRNDPVACRSDEA